MAPVPYPLELLKAMAATAKPVYVGTGRWDTPKRRDRNRKARAARRTNRRGR